MVKEKALVVEEGRPDSIYEHACAQAQGVKVIIDVLGRDSGFSLGPSNTLHYRGRPLDGRGTFKMHFRGMTMWLDKSLTEAVVTYVHNSMASELTVECNGDFAIVTSFRSGDLGIPVPPPPSEENPELLLIDGDEAEAAFGGLPQA